jgi:predicted dehydrogenase
VKNKIKILLSGPGLIGKQHGELIHSHEDCCLAAIIVPENSPDRQNLLSTGARIYSDIETALDNEKIDAAVISSPNSFHFNQAISCILKGIPVLVEKPITDNIHDAYELVKESERLKVPLLVGHHRTYSPFLESAQSFLKTEKFGKMVAVQGSALFYKPSQYFIDGVWRTKIGGGPILINLIHEIGLLRYFCGEIKRVFAFSSNNIRNFEVEDTVTISFEFISGALGNFLLSDTAASSKSWEMTSGENPMYPHYPGDYCYHFSGTNGSLDFPNMEARMYENIGHGSWSEDFQSEKLQTASKNPLNLQLNHFVDVILKRCEPKVSARDGYMNMLVVKAIEQSIKTGVSVNVDARS